MPKTYLVGCYRVIKNPNALAAYAKLGGLAVVAKGGKHLLAADVFTQLEGGIEERTVVVVLESFDTAIAQRCLPTGSGHPR